MFGIFICSLNSNISFPQHLVLKCMSLNASMVLTMLNIQSKQMIYQDFLQWYQYHKKSRKTCHEYGKAGEMITSTSYISDACLLIVHFCS